MEIAMSMIDVQEVSHSYAGGFPALEKVSLKIGKGERVAVLGPNGAGKSTLFHTLNGLLSPTSGKIYIDGLLVEKKNLSQIRSKVGMVFQDADDQLFNASVRQEVAYGPMHMHLSEKEVDDAVNWALEAAGIGDYSDKSPHNLSGGEKKRVALASVLAMKPDVLVLDEPTAELDPQGASSLVKLLNDLNKELGITLIFSSHDTDIVPLLSDRTYLMNKGKIILSGTTAEVFAQTDIIRQSQLRLPRVAHLTEILIKQGGLQAGCLPLTIGQAKRLLEKSQCVNELSRLGHGLGRKGKCSGF
jgi:cobalt/nickel transport system ATP-binding protein